jgi:periplasmic nitrate reductase NapE
MRRPLRGVARLLRRIRGRVVVAGRGVEAEVHPVHGGCSFQPTNAGACKMSRRCIEKPKTHSASSRLDTCAAAAILSGNRQGQATRIVMEQGRNPHSKADELRAFLLLSVVMAPVLAVLVVSGYGFLVWMVQLVAGPPGG